IVIKSQFENGLTHNRFLRGEVVAKLGKKSVLVECSDTIRARQLHNVSKALSIVHTVLVDNERVFVPVNSAKSDQRIIGENSKRGAYLVEYRNRVMTNDYKVEIATK